MSNSTSGTQLRAAGRVPPRPWRGTDFTGDAHRQTLFDGFTGSRNRRPVEGGDRLSKHFVAPMGAGGDDQPAVTILSDQDFLLCRQAPTIELRGLQLDNGFHKREHLVGIRAVGVAE